MGTTETLFHKYSEASSIFHISLYFWITYILGKCIREQTKMHMHKGIHYSIICNCKIVKNTKIHKHRWLADTTQVGLHTMETYTQIKRRKRETNPKELTGIEGVCKNS